jgi:hypothetical protein
MGDWGFESYDNKIPLVEFTIRRMHIDASYFLFTLPLNIWFP